MKFSNFCRQNYHLILIIMLISGIMVLIVASCLQVIDLTNKLPFKEEVLFINPLTGERESPFVKINPLAVIIDNNIAARPQAGLAQAAMVYEALVEGGITRLLAIYNYNDEIKKVGPIRSLRPYFLDWAQEYQPTLLHVGGSQEALTALKDYSIINLDEMSANGIYFDRGDSAAWPYTVYSSSALWQTFPDLKGRQVKFEPWAYQPISEKYCPSAGQEVIINYSYNEYQVKWQYDCQGGHYLRFNGNEKHQDGNGNQLYTNKVIVQFVKSWLIDKERLAMQTTGQGKALIFQNGQVVEGNWQKEAKFGRTRFYDSAGQLIKLTPGKTWIEIVPPLTNITY